MNPSARRFEAIVTVALFLLFVAVCLTSGRL